MFLWRGSKPLRVRHQDDGAIRNSAGIAGIPDCRKSAGYRLKKNGVVVVRRPCNGGAQDKASLRSLEPSRPGAPCPCSARVHAGRG